MMKIKLSIETDKGIPISSVELKPRGICFDEDSCRRLISMMGSDAREEPLTLLARNIGRSIGPEDVFQLCRAVVNGK